MAYLGAGNDRATTAIQALLMMTTSITGKRLLPWLLALLPALLVIGIRWNAGPGRDAEDYAHYIMHARNIVEGRPYADTGCIDSRYVSFRCSPQPPGTPLTLAALYFVVGEHELPTALLMLAMTLGFAVVAGWYFARHDRMLGLGVTLLSLLAPGILGFAAHVQSDLPFALFAWATFLVADRAGPWSWGRVAAIVALSFATLSYRVLGVALVPGLFVIAVLRRKELGWRGFIPFLCLGGALFAVLLARGVPTLVIAYLSSISMAQHIVPVRLGLSHALLYPLPSDQLNDGYHVLAALLAALGLAMWVRAGGLRTLAFGFGAAYLCLLLVLPFGVSRYFWPLTPLVVFGLLRGLALAASALPRLRTVAQPSAVALSLAVLISVGATANVLASPWPGWLAKDPDTHALFAALRSLADSQTVRPAFFKPRVLTMETGLDATSIFKAPPDSGRALLERLCITHVVIGSNHQHPFVDASMRNLVRAFPRDFALVFSNPTYRVYRFAPARCPGEHSGESAATR